jgi:hypothetical protein
VYASALSLIIFCVDKKGDYVGTESYIGGLVGDEGDDQARPNIYVSTSFIRNTREIDDINHFVPASPSFVLSSGSCFSHAPSAQNPSFPLDT